MMKKIFSQLLSAHIIITVIVIIISVVGPHNNVTLWFAGITSCLLYFFSGYILTKEKNEWYNYFGVACIGVLFWLICFAISPNSMSYKGNPEAEIWLLYQFYIMVSYPLNFIDSLNEHYSHMRQLIIDLMVPILISGFQFLGGWTKLRLKD